MDKRHSWKQDAACLGYDTNFFFDKYEEDESFRPAIDEICSGCPVAKQCLLGRNMAVSNNRKKVRK